MINNKFSYLKAGEAKFEGFVHDAVLFTEEHQLLNKKTWDKFIEVFSCDYDDENNGWRCEFWGKMMRGACLTYMYRGTDELYEVIEYAVKGLLKNQRADGRFSSYSKENEFNGWDLWGRKYVLTAMIHFIAICKDGQLKNEALAAICRHADYIVEHIGDTEGKKSLLETSTFWLSVNSCSILEPFVELYKLTNDSKYFEFAKYIISLGGCSGENLIDLAIEDKKAPYEYPQTKAYETMSFFEGVLAYYEITGEEKYLDAVLKFIEKVYATDITLIGCAGCEGELFDNAVVKQSRFSVSEMQETCVTVTWIRVLARLLALTGDSKYADRIENAAYNALYGSMNTEQQFGYSLVYKVPVPPLPFDSYSPLVDNKRGISIGGLQPFKDGGEYGCCACIGSAGTALSPLTAVMKSETGIVINAPLSGEIHTALPSGQVAEIKIKSDYPVGGSAKIKLSLAKSENFALLIKVPNWCKNADISVGGVKFNAENGYANIERLWQNGDTVTVDFEMKLISYKQDGRTAFTYGPIVLARDEKKSGGNIEKPIAKDETSYRILTPEKGENVRIAVKADCGELILTDYASAGKHWNKYFTRVSVWMK